MNQSRDMTAIVVASSTAIPVSTIKPVMIPSLTPIPPGVIRDKTPRDMLRGQQKITLTEKSI